VPAPVPAWALAVGAVFAVAVPTLIAFNVAPSATFFNQAAALVGWGGFLIVLATCLPGSAWPRSRGALALLAAMTLTAISALSASVFGAVPSTLSLSAVGTILPAVLVVAIAASTQRAGLADLAFRAFCIGLVVAGIASALIGLVQVFAPHSPDGNWVALAALAGRATGNLRQPNHLSSVLLWSVVGAVWLGQAKALDDRIAAVLVVVFIYVIVLTGSRTGALGMLTLAGWGLLDRRLSRRARIVLALAPLLYAAMWWGTLALGRAKQPGLRRPDALQHQRRHGVAAPGHLVQRAGADRVAPVVRRRLRRLQLRLDADAVPGAAERVLRPHPQPHRQLPGRDGRAAGGARPRAHAVRAPAGARPRDPRRPRAGLGLPPSSALPS
jgi:hypothetical protein